MKDKEAKAKQISIAKEILKELDDEKAEKEKAIKLLLNEDFNYTRDNISGMEWIEQILINGFKGYINMTLKDLKDEIKAREI